MLLPCWLLIFRTSAEGHLGFMEGTEAYFLFEDANKIHYCKVRLLCLDLKKKNTFFFGFGSRYRIEYTLHN